MVEKQSYFLSDYCEGGEVGRLVEEGGGGSGIGFLMECSYCEGGRSAGGQVGADVLGHLQVEEGWVGSGNGFPYCEGRRGVEGGQVVMVLREPRHVY